MSEEERQDTYLTFINNARKAVAIVMAVCGAGFVICTHRDEYWRLTLGRDSGMWGWGCWVFGRGILACLAVTLSLVIERLARPAPPAPVVLRTLIIRTLLILTVVVAVGWSMLMAFGREQAMGAVAGVLLFSAAVRWFLSRERAHA